MTGPSRIVGRINVRTVLAIGHDIAAAAAAWCTAYWLRFNLNIPEFYVDGMKHALLWVVPLQAVVFWAFGLYRGIWRYASLPDLRRIVLAVFLSATALPFLFFMLSAHAPVPRSVLILDPFLLLIFMGGSRLVYRAWKEHRIYGLMRQEGRPALILGAGDAAISLIKELERTNEWRVVGILEDNQKKHGRMLQGVKVLGDLDDLPQLAKALAVESAIIALPSVSSKVRRHVVDLCNQAQIKALTVPSVDDLMSGKVTVSQIRNVELDDLLGRDPVVLDNQGLHRLLESRVIMVTGAGGSIGSELCRQIAKFQPRTLILFELNEFNLYAVEQEFQNTFPDISLVCSIGDVKNRSRVNEIFERHRPQVVFHAAAYKHVPLLEGENAHEAVRNNVLGTYVVAQASSDHGVEKFVLVSTDKAVNPTNVMGASKRLAEMVCQAIQQNSGTQFVMVRFGNVLGSTGSVIPKFREQLAKCGPITVTHPEITRYFMSIPEAAQLVLQAGFMGSSGEIFVLDMGEPVRNVDLAKDLIKLSGLSSEEVKIVYTGLRPGEKLYEELLADGENTVATPHPKLRIAQARPVDKSWLNDILVWLNQSQTSVQIREELPRWVPEYRLPIPDEEMHQEISPASGTRLKHVSQAN